jgi:hypothetical protein
MPSSQVLGLRARCSIKLFFLVLLLLFSWWEPKEAREGRNFRAKINLASGASICTDLQVPSPLLPCGRGDRQGEEGGHQIWCLGARVGVRMLLRALEALIYRVPKRPPLRTAAAMLDKWSHCALGSDGSPSFFFLQAGKPMRRIIFNLGKGPTTANAAQVACSPEAALASMPQGPVQAVESRF